VRRDFDDAVLFENDILSKHAVDAAAERTLVGVRSRLPRAPALKEVADDFVPNLDAPDPCANLDDLAGAVG
jgi:hypothetical protein